MDHFERKRKKDARAPKRESAMARKARARCVAALSNSPLGPRRLMRVPVAYSHASLRSCS